MPAFAVELADKATGKTHRQRVVADSRADVANRVDSDAYLVGDIQEAENFAKAETSPDGKGYANAAAVAVFVSLFFVPAAMVAMVLGGAAMERSGGRRGSGAVAAAALVCLLWTVGIVAVVLQLRAR